MVSVRGFGCGRVEEVMVMGIFGQHVGVKNLEGRARKSESYLSTMAVVFLEVVGGVEPDTGA